MKAIMKTCLLNTIYLRLQVWTGNLTKELQHQGYSIIGVEPSAEMRRIAKEKLPNVAILDGHFLSIPITEKFNSIVTSYAFHHLTYSEKKKALQYLDSFLHVGGKIVIADTMFESKEYKSDLFKYVEQSKAFNLLNDLNSEYYEYLEDLLAIFKELNYTYEANKVNKYVWVVSAQKKN